MDGHVKDRIAKAIGYVLGAVIAGLLVFWTIYKIYNFASLF
ncbi:MAG TPA: hypothetical protein VK601_01090 [Kofleriaceae bacterium]|nr:hypothetical protein [Kofleriaceae bacterium]